tara:strand:- start:850 stop:1539 length:690 start_codon:yes stop_codon:yes gene_type:complete
MTLSGTTNFGIATDQQALIDEAWERVGREASYLSVNDVQSAIRSLSYLFSEWSNRGVNLWKVNLISQALTTGMQSFALNSNNVDMLQVYRRETNGGVDTDSTLSEISRADYAALPLKQQQGTPQQFYFERTVTPTMYIWQTPSDARWTLWMYVMLMQDDPGNPTATLDAPQRWFDAMASGMAARLSQKWAPERQPALQAQADRAFTFAAAEDTEKVPTRIVPDVLGRRF